MVGGIYVIESNHVWFISIFEGFCFFSFCFSSTDNLLTAAKKSTK
jgi:hypothetical protein